MCQRDQTISSGWGCTAHTDWKGATTQWRNYRAYAPMAKRAIQQMP